MFKRLFFAVLGFWLLKKYVKPYFDDRREARRDRRDVAGRRGHEPERRTSVAEELAVV